MLELAILGLLKERPMHGYDLRKRMRSGFGLVASLSFGSLYPALARLQQAGAVREVTPPELESAPGTPAHSSGDLQIIPLTGSLTGERAAFRARLAARAATAARATASGTRSRKVYAITPLGEDLFAELLTRADDRGRLDDDKDFALRWSFARHLGTEARLHLLDHHRRRLQDRLARAERSLEQARSIDRYERQLADHTIDSLTRELAWVDELITAEHAGSALPITETDVS